MERISKAGSGFIKLDGTLINLKAYQQIRKDDEINDPMICFTPLIPLKEEWENGSDGSWTISYDTVEERDEHFEKIEEALKD